MMKLLLAEVWLLLAEVWLLLLAELWLMLAEVWLLLVEVWLLLVEIWLLLAEVWLLLAEVCLLLLANTDEAVCSPKWEAEVRLGSEGDSEHQPCGNICCLPSILIAGPPM
jgi:hypothetical protein